jgi:hypothetical protein
LWLTLAAWLSSCGAPPGAITDRGGPPPQGLAGSVVAESGAIENPGDPPFHYDAGVSSEDDAGGDQDAMTAAPLTTDSSCARGKAPARLEPVNMFVMVDRSGSMNDDDKWLDATAALLFFFRDPKAAGMRVALRFFPHDVPITGCDATACDSQACAEPLVPLGELTTDFGELDPQERALVLGIAHANPDSATRDDGTPIYAALEGALRWATSYKADHPSEKTVVVFATDGEPNGCNEDFSAIAALAATALQTSSVTTYAIGLQGSNAAQIAQLAQAGGTRQSILVDPGPNAEQELVNALNAIRGETVSCDFAMPAASDTKLMIDPSRVNVTWKPASGAAGTLSQVPDANSCGTRKSWYYDAPQAPTRIELCPAACDLVRGDASATLEVLLGCVTACGALDQTCAGAPPPADVPPVLF